MQSVMRQRFWILEEHHGGAKNCGGALRAAR
jgi:hypothetical protein